MAARRIAPETLDVVLQEKAKRYHVDPSAEAVSETLHLKAPDLLRATPRSRADMYEGAPSDGRLLSSSVPHSRDAGREGLRGDVFPGRSFKLSNPAVSDDSYFRKECGQGLEFAHPDSQDPVFGPRKLGHFQSQDWKLVVRGSWEQGLGPQVSSEPSWVQECGLGTPAVPGDITSSRRMEKECAEEESRDYNADPQGKDDAVPRSHGQSQARGQEGALLGKGETEDLLTAKGGAGKLTILKSVATKKAPAVNRIPSKPQGSRQIQKATLRPDITLGTHPGVGDIHLPVPKVPLGLDLKTIHFPGRRTSFDLIDKTDVFSRFGVEIIKWAGFHTIRDDARFSQLFQTLFELETETCAKTLASFKCSLKPEHRDFCFFTIKFLKHSALKTPRVDNEFLNMLLDKGAVKTKNCFFEIIKPFDKYIMRLQDRLLKSVTPLLMACNAYELSVKMKTLTSPLDLALALETTNSLCRKSLALLGQTFSLASSFRQEKILEAVGLQDIAPSPAAFPNFEDSTLFGREYMEHLKAWLLTSGYPLQVRKAPQPAPEEEEEERASPTKSDLHPGTQRPLIDAVPPRADHTVTATIEQLVMRVLDGSLSPKERAALKEDPAYWFLADEGSLEYKYYELKLSEAGRRIQDRTRSQQSPTPAECAVRAMLYARLVHSLKKKLLPCRRRRPLRAQGHWGWPAGRATTGTQTRLSSGARPKPHSWRAPGSSQTKSPLPSGRDTTKDSLPGPTGSAPATCSLEESGRVSTDVLGTSRTSSPCPAANVDMKTMETAEKLAKFVAQVGPEIEQFSIENSTDNPDLWFLHDQSSPAFKFYRNKVFELCPSISFPPTHLPPPTSTGHADPTGAQGELDEDHEEEEEEVGEEAPTHGTSGPRAGTSRSEGSVGSPAADGLPADVADDEPAGPGLVQASPGTCLPRKRMSSKSLKVGMIPAPKRACLVPEPEVHEPVRIAYDRPRGRPIAKKKKPTDLDFPQQKLTGQNLGFQMLQKMGWKEGHGLGSSGTGIREPVSLGMRSEREGLGADGPERTEDTFDVFRQRMMQMYRHKRANK
ncbi:SURP and G-patch domain-containing protein 2 [Perognathus longimembris pacificus]|uniref:SURP and G-patch domain-containing protein 2 n=1 Tax=Perognathus longimembris pacificus TaxID=214514 RepID=UPI00201999F4|nr:SURP and G-patch domain-containing protein 2 [Perognathus longimembris pacificus]XP_048198557.1 SURP and G-patch domain-containing protein 2 [Perognathus longimembris pacificus]